MGVENKHIRGSKHSECLPKPWETEGATLTTSPHTSRGITETLSLRDTQHIKVIVCTHRRYYVDINYIDSLFPNILPGSLLTGFNRNILRICIFSLTNVIL